MMIVALDTTALTALHINAPGRSVVMRAIDEHDAWCASALALGESLALVDRLTEEPALRRDLEDAIRRTWDHLHIVPVDQRCLDDATHLSRIQPLGTSSAIHLAAALRLPGPITYVTFDPAQITVALALGFDVRST
jgi:predicted nucleic acid-binding protein